MNKNKTIVVETKIIAPIQKVWNLWTQPEHIKKWNKASDDWQTTKVENDLRVGGKFNSRMEAKDGSIGFDFGGTYNEVEPNELISYTLEDGRMVVISFSSEGNFTKILETFEPEDQNTLEVQKQGWQAILDSFKKYTESKS